MKPRQKVVTAEDIASSLYYLHVSSTEDESLLQAQANAFEHHTTAEEDRLPQLPARPALVLATDGLPYALRPGAATPAKHPLPSLPPYPLEDGPPSIPIHDSNARHAGMSIPRKPAPSMPQRKPVGLHSREPEPEPPALPQRRSPGRSSDDSSSPRPFLAQRPTMSTATPHSESSPEVIVIRRNPASLEQWNVATISDPPVFEIASDGRSGSMTNTKIRKSGQPLYLHMTTSGYHKFLPPGQRSGASSVTNSAPSLVHSGASTVDSNLEPVFTRRMWLEGSLFEKHASGHRKSLSADQADHGYPSPRPTFNSTHSSESTQQHSRMYGSEDTSSYGAPDMRRLSLVGDQKRSNTRGYTFLSPWDGRCEFASGTMGNSLKCRHLRMKNSLSPDSNVPSQISELRFNLPGGGPMASEPRRKSSGKYDKYGQKVSKRERLLAKFSDRDSSHDDQSHTTENEDDRLDLSLGQELAGGGFAGKQAKLGKLIIEGEGLQMLDLLVAANMALWFRAYEKYQEGGGR